MERRKAGENKITIGDITDVSGEVNIAAGDIYKGYTAEQVSVLLTQITTTFQPKPFDGRCPYKGLDVFEEEDAELFFGRDKLVDDLVNRVKESQTAFITGPSGSGKSSLVRAGLIHALKHGSIKALHSERWLYETMKPGRDPMAELARVTASFAGTLLAGQNIRTIGLNDPTILAQWCEIALKDSRDKRVVIFIDQFEEVFTQISKETERLAFLNLLTYGATSENGRLIALIAMRSDFVSNCATYPELNALLNQQFIQIGSMQPDELVSAIAQPALRVGLRIDPDLIAQIINEMEGEPGALPLMQFALKDLFDAQQAQGGVIALTLNDYLQRGGIHKALQRHADESFVKLDKYEQELARSIFSRLIEIGRGTQDTRRTALFDELIPANARAEEVEAIVGKLADARLVTTDEQAGKDTVTISHEKLIDAWPWLKKLVNENRDVIALQNEIATDAKEWEVHNQDSSYLYSGARLANAFEQLEAKKLMLSGTAHEFVQAGRARQRRGQISLIAGISFIIVFLIIAVIIYRQQSSANAELAKQKGVIASTAQAASTLAVQQRNEAQHQTQIARAGELAAQAVALLDRNYLLSLLFTAEAYQRVDNIQTRSVLLDNWQANPQLHAQLYGHGNYVTSVAFSPDGKTLASGSWDNTIILWDVDSKQPIGQPMQAHGSAITSVAFNPDGNILASGSEDNTIILWDVASRQPIGQPLTGHTDIVYSVAFSPDGKTLVSGSGDGTIILWDVASGQPIGQPLTGHTDIVYSVAFSPDGKTLASGSYDKTIILWDVMKRRSVNQPLTGHTDIVYSVAFSPDGKTLVSGSGDGTIILWDIASRQPIGQPLTGHNSFVYSLAFSPDGKILASGSGDNTIILWDIASRQPIGQPLTGHGGLVTSLAFNLDGRTLASGSYDESIILWNVFSDQLIGQPLTAHNSFVYSVAFSPDGKTLASGSRDKTIILWDVVSGKPIGQPLTGHSDFVTSVAFSPDGKTLASGSWDKTIILWNVDSGKPIGQPPIKNDSIIESLAFSPDSRILVSGDRDGSITLWDVASGQPISQPLTRHSDLIRSVAFSPDGKTLASGSLDSTIILWDVASGQPIGQPLAGHHSSVESVAFSRDGKILASGSQDGTIILWNAAEGKPIGQPLVGQGGHVRSVAFSPDGRILASGSRDGTITLWDIETRQPIGQPLSGHTSVVFSVAFSPNGKILASGSGDNTILLWDVDPQSWLNKTCQRAGRNFTRAEWQQYFPGEEYRVTCSQWPAGE